MKEEKYEYEIKGFDLNKMGLNADQYDWRNYDVEVTDIRDDNIKALSDTKIFKNTFKTFPAMEPISTSQTLSLSWESVTATSCTVAVLVVLIMWLAKRNKSSSALVKAKPNSTVVSSHLNLTDSLEKLTEVTNKAYHFHPEDRQSVELIEYVVRSLFAHLTDNYDLLETSDAAETVMAQIDTLLFKINKQANTYQIEHHAHSNMQQKTDRLARYQAVERVKGDLAELRGGLAKVVFLDERRHRQETYSKLRQAISFNNVSELLHVCCIL